MSEAIETPGTWAEMGPDDCPFCLVAMSAELGYYCATCDRLVCPACVATVFESRTCYCPLCAAELEADG